MFKKSKKRIALVMLLSIVLVCTLPFIINKSLGAIYNVESNLTTDNSNVVLNYSEAGTSSSLNFDISLKEEKNYSYYLITKFKPTSIELPLNTGNYKLVLKSSTNNSTFTTVSEKNITTDVLNTDLIFIDAGIVSQSKVYYKLILYANGEEQDIRVKNISGNFSVKVYTGSVKTTGSTTNFSYTGQYRQFNVSESREYVIELWGASGAPFTYEQGLPGKGGYTKGNIYLNSGDILYFYVGGEGQTDLGHDAGCKAGAGGWNGGGNGGENSCERDGDPGSGGGGATDVRIVRTPSLTAWKETASLNSRIMVAGAGGTRGYYGIRGDAGGLIGHAAGAHSSASQISTGGTQSSGGQTNDFNGDCGSPGYLGEGGEGQIGFIHEGNMIASGDGGGGGYYGGGGSGNKDLSGTGGGSSYISGHGGCTTHSSGKTFTDTLMIDGRGYKWTTSQGPLQQMPNPEGGYYALGDGRVGNGYAKISTIVYISNNTIYTWSKNSVKATLTVNYVDENGNTLKSSDINELLADETYVTNAPTSFENFDNYELITTPTNAIGILPVEGATVNYIYRLKSSNVIVHHYLEGTTTSIDGGSDEILSGQVTKNYTTSSKNIEKYELVNTPSNANGTYKIDIEKVIYYYRLRDESSVNVVHKLDSDSSVLDRNTINGYVGRNYVTQSNTYNNHELKTTPNNASGVFEEENEDVIYIYTLKTGSSIIIHHYLEGTTTSIDGGPDETLNGKVTESYTTNPKSIEKYKLVDIPNNQNGTFTFEEQIVTYYYKLRNEASVSVIHRLDTGETLDSSVIEGYEGNQYTTSSKTFTNCELKTTPSNASGTLTISNQTVIYIYTLKQGADIIVHHYLEGTTITIDGAEDETISGKITTHYSTRPKTIEKYQLVSMPSNATGMFTSSIQEVIYYYKLRNGSNLDIVHKLDSGDILNTDIRSGYVGNSYSTDPRIYENYELKTMPSNASGVFGEENEDIIYIYTLKIGGKVTVHHYLEGTTTSIDNGNDITLTGKVTESYTTSSIISDDYNLVSTPSNADGVFTKADQIVTYYYRLKVSSNITVLYKGETGNILDRKDIVGKVGNSYETEEKQFKNYTLSKIPNNKSGVYTEQAQEVIYVYSLNEGAKVTIHHYLKGTTTTITDDVILNGKITTPYISKSLSMENYKLVETPSNAIGTFTDVEQTVTYYYEEKTPTIIEIVYVDTSGKILDEKKEDGYIGDEYTSEEKKFENYELLNVSDNWHGTLQENNEKVYYTYSLVQNPKTGIGNTLWISLTVIILGIFAYLYVSKKQIFNI